MVLLIFTSALMSANSYFFQIDKSNANIVVLNSLKLSSSGTYRCEVSAEAPSFQTVFQDKDLITVGM